MVRRRNEHMLHNIVFFCRSACYSLASATLTAITGNRNTLYKARMRDRYDDVLFGDHIFDREVFSVRDALCAAAVREFILYFRKIFGDDLKLKLL